MSLPAPPDEDTTERRRQRVRAGRRSRKRTLVARQRLRISQVLLAALVCLFAILFVIHFVETPSPVLPH